MGKKTNRAIIEKGVKIRGWELLSILGQGGNGEVWEVSKPGHANHAIKILRRAEAETYLRFKSEIHILESHKIIGVIELIDSFLPSDYKNETAWYLMPKAETFDSYAEGKSKIDIAREFVLLGQTLAELHSLQIAHRDIKPANILYHKGRLCLADFGLVKFPGKENHTPPKRDVGAKFTMAPEMRREGNSANGIPADVYSLAKSLWIALTGESKGFDGQYISSSDLSLEKHLPDLYINSLERLLIECTANNPAERPSATLFSSTLNSWIEVNKDFHTRNQIQWLEFQKEIFPLGAPSTAVWRDIDSIFTVLNAMARFKNLNHMFFPDGGGMDLNLVTKAYDESMLILHHGDTPHLVKPNKLTFESIGFHHQWNYFRLELDQIEALGVGPMNSEFDEYILEESPGLYVSAYKYGDGKSPKGSRLLRRYIEGCFVFFNKVSIFNKLRHPSYDAYNGRHNKMSEDEFREHILFLARAVNKSV